MVTFNKTTLAAFALITATTLSACAAPTTRPGSYAQPAPAQPASERSGPPQEAPRSDETARNYPAPAATQAPAAAAVALAEAPATLPAHMPMPTQTGAGSRPIVIGRDRAPIE